MPTLQVLDHQPDRSVENIQAASNAFADNLYKSQSLKLTAQYYKNLAKQTENETEKFHFERLAKLNNDILPQILSAANNPAQQTMLLQSLKDSGQYKGNMDQLMHDIADSNAKNEEFKKLAAQGDSNAQQQVQSNQYMTEGGLRNAQASNFGAEAQAHRAAAANQQASADFVNRYNKGAGQSGNGAPVGTTASIGPGGTTINMPLNPDLSDQEQSSIASADKFGALSDNISKAIDSGVLNSGKSRLYTQALADGGNNMIGRILTKDNSPLEKLSSDLTEIKKYAFGEGGKTLSKDESRIVFPGLKTLGKGDAQIKHDIKEAIKILQRKRAIALGGSNAANFKPGSPGMNAIDSMSAARPHKDLSDDDLARRIQELQGGVSQ